MKKIYFFAALAAVALASCSNDETVAQYQGEAISFRPFVSNVTRASATNDITGPAAGAAHDLAKFKVTAYPTGTSATPYINAATYQYDNSGTFYVDGASASGNKYANEYYWPASTNLDFYAHSYYGTNWFTSAEVTSVLYNGYTFTPSTTANSTYTDVIFARISNIGKKSSYDTTKEYGADGVPLNFRHTASKIAVKVINSSKQLKFDIDGWKVGYLSASGVFAVGSSETSTAGSGTFAFGDWTSNTTKDADTQYSSTFDKKYIGTEVATASAVTLDGEMILVPQRLTAATAYQTSGDDDHKLNGAFIAVKLIIRNTDSSVDGEGTVIASDGASTPGTIWAIWPIGDDGTTTTFNWEPGKKYTYTIDLAGGGYYEEDQNDDGNLDPILAGAIIKFVSVTVDNWNTDTANDQSVVMP